MNEREDIKAFIDGELSPGRAAEVRAAIESDPELKKEYEAMKNITQSLASLVRQPQVKGAERALQSAKGRKRFRWVEGLVVAGVLAVVGIVAFPIFAQSKNAARDVAYSTGDEAARKAVIEDSDAMKADTLSGGAVSKDASVPAALPDVEGYAVPQPGTASEKAGRGRTEPVLPMGGAGGAARALQHNGAVAASKAPILQEEQFQSKIVQRQVVKDASLAIKVEDVNKAMDAATALVAESKGYIESSDSSLDQQHASGTMNVRVPQDRFEEALGRLRALGEVYAQHSSGDDVTAQVTDYESNVKTLTAELESYRAMLAKARSTGEILQIKDRITGVQMQIDSLLQQAATLRSLAALSTISVRFTRDKEPVAGGPVLDDDRWFDGTKETAVGILGGFGKLVAQVGTYLVVLAPIWAPIVLFALWVRKRLVAQPG